MPDRYHPSPSIAVVGPDSTFDVSIYSGADARGTVKETPWTDNGMEVAIDFMCPWEKRLEFLYVLRGSCGYRQGRYWRYLPMSLPLLGSDAQPNAKAETAWEVDRYPWVAYYCSSVGECRHIRQEIDQDKTLVGVLGWPKYQYVVVPTRWSVPLYTIAEDPFSPTRVGFDPSGFPYTTTRWRISGEIFSPYTNAYQFEHETTPVNEANVGIQRIKTELSITRHFMPFVDTIALDKIYGTVNRDPIQIGGDVNPTHSMLHLGYETQEYINPSNGTIVYDITHRIMVNGPVMDKDGVPQESWNYFMNRSGNWDRLIQRDGGGTVYHSSQFKCVIWPEYVNCEDGGPPGVGPGGPDEGGDDDGDEEGEG